MRAWSILALCSLMTLVNLVACDKEPKKDGDIEEEAAPPAVEVPAPAKNLDRGTITEQQGDTTLSWRVSPDGEVWGLATHKGDEVPASQVDATIEVRSLPRGEPATFTLKEASGLLHAKIPKLDAALTEIRYTAKVKGELMKGVLHVPKAGTIPLVEGADIAGKASAVKPGAKGPHGGVVQVVGDDVVEIVGKKGTGDLRVYLLDDNLKPEKVRNQKMQLALADDGSHLVELEAHDTKDYLYGDVELTTNPRKITVVIDDGDDVDCAVVGYYPGTVFVVGPSAPVFFVYVVESWDVVVVAAPRVHYRKGKGKWNGKKGKYKHKH